MTGDELEMLPSSRGEARGRGLDRFFSGISCKYGHLAPRYVSTTNCVACQAEHARRYRGWQARPSKATYLDQARKRIEQRGGVLLSTKYVSAKMSLKVRCAAGHEFDVTPDNLRHGRWCSGCKWKNQSKRLALKFRSVEELRQFARDRHGGDCWVTTPAPMLSKVIWKCAKAEHPPFEA